MTPIVRFQNRPSSAQSFSTKVATLTSLTALLAACGGGGGGGSNTQSVVDTPTDTPNDTDSVPNTEAPTKVSLMVNSGGNASVSETGVDQLDIVFAVSASFDAKALDDNAVINLGLDRDGNEVASQGRADFDEVSHSNATLNIHATQQNIEIDYKKGVDGNLTINFENNDGDILLGEEDYVTTANQAIQVFDAGTLTINHKTDQDVLIQGSVLIDDFTTDIVVTTSKTDGALSVVGADNLATFDESAEVRTFKAHAVDGDLNLISFDPFHGGGHLIADATKFQSLDVIGHDAAIQVGSIGYLSTFKTIFIDPILGASFIYNEFAGDLETINVALTGSASLYQHHIGAHTADIAEVVIQSGEGDTVTSDFNLHDNVPLSQGNVVFEALGAKAIERLVIDTSNGGSVVMDNQSYVLNDAVFMGSGDIILVGPGDLIELRAVGGDQGGIRQTQPVDASGHTGERIFYTRLGEDIIYGSDQDDTIIFRKFDGIPGNTFVLTDDGDHYYDSGGDDLIHVGGYDIVRVFDGDPGTNDTYLINHLPYASGFFPSAVEFHAGSGNDIIDIDPSQLTLLPSVVSIDFGTWINGHLDIDGFDNNFYTISLDGLPGITNSSITNVGLGTTINHIDDNSIYLGLSGDQALNGVSITDYNNIQQAADFLNEFVSGVSQQDDSAIFIVQNNTLSSASGDDANYYFYLFNESDGLSGISDSEITHFASLELGNTNLFGFPFLGPLADSNFV
jgi:hypothetical protein